MQYSHSAFNDQITDEELAHIWTLNPLETDFINKHQFQYKLHVALQRRQILLTSISFSTNYMLLFSYAH